MPHGQTHRVVVSASAPHTSAIMLIRYMWSAMLSGWCTPRFTQPVRFVLCGGQQWLAQLLDVTGSADHIDAGIVSCT